MEIFNDIQQEIAKKIDNENAVLSDDKKSFKIEGNLEKFMSEDFSMDTNVKLKSK